MSNPGKQPSAEVIRYTPLAVTPTNPIEGDLFYSDGTSRALGLWSYTASAWAQVSTGSTLSVLDNLTLTPQATDPATPAEGMLFMSDGTARAEGLWLRQDSQWQQLGRARTQLFTQKAPVEVRVATTAAITLASQAENGDTIDGIVLATGDLILVKNQVTASENGVYIVAASGAPTRATAADTFSELNNFVAYVLRGTVNTNKFYFQTATLTSLSDSQIWSTTAPTFNFTVPYGVSLLRAELLAGGGGGSMVISPSIGGGGGGGCIPLLRDLPVTAGDAITVTVGMGGLGVGRAQAAAAGSAGGPSALSGTGLSISVPGAAGGVLGGAGAEQPAISAGAVYTTGGTGDIAGTGAQAGQATIYAAAGIAGTSSNGAAGGGGGAGVAAGAEGGSGTVGFNETINSGKNAAANSGAGGGGNGNTSGGANGNSGYGGSGYVRLSW